jgi:hypothetical protein
MLLPAVRLVAVLRLPADSPDVHDAMWDHRHIER